MKLIDRLLAGFRHADLGDAEDPGLILDDSGVLWGINPDGSRARSNVFTVLPLSFDDPALSPGQFSGYNSPFMNMQAVRGGELCLQLSGGRYLAPTSTEGAGTMLLGAF